MFWVQFQRRGWTLDFYLIPNALNLTKNMYSTPNLVLSFNSHTVYRVLFMLTLTENLLKNSNPFSLD